MAADGGGPFPAHFFRRVDEGDDALFYREPRFVQHIDRATIGALTDFYREAVAEGSRVLDLMSSWVSHLPDGVAYGRVSGLGMNRAELADNPRLDDFEVHDLNRDPALPYGDGEFDAAVCAVSVQYLTRPLEVFRLGAAGAAARAASARWRSRTACSRRRRSRSGSRWRPVIGCASSARTSP